jgi:hypothetical protein
VPSRSIEPREKIYLISITCIPICSTCPHCATRWWCKSAKCSAQTTLLGLKAPILSLCWIPLY